MQFFSRFHVFHSPKFKSPWWDAVLLEATYSPHEIIWQKDFWLFSNDANTFLLMMLMHFYYDDDAEIHKESKSFSY